MKQEANKFLLTIIILSSIISKSCSQNRSNNADSFVLACGVNIDATDSDGRKWTSDVEYLGSPNTSLSATAKSQDPALPSTIPYMTARIFESESTYKFVLSQNGRHWIRLHFYPSIYQNFDSSRSFISVTANGLTLLNNFSASITAEAFSLAYVVREFSIVNIKSTTLELTFTPQNNSFAFVNGIEIISMPEIFQPVSMIGFSDQNLDATSFSMQTMYRLNVGGQYILANEDSGLSRTWYDDSPYIYGAASGVTSEAEDDVFIKYPSEVPKYIAPAGVYSTARSMGPNATVNENYNLTWVFEVDVEFTYLVRLHFCEFHLDLINQMVFSIFINNQTAEAEADVIGWSGGKGIPVYKDYAVFVNGRDGDDHLWLALHPNMAVKPEYADAILNGVEIFKFNDAKMNLAGPNPEPHFELPNGPRTQNPSSKSRKRGIIIGSVILGSFACSGALIFLVLFLRRSKGTDKDVSSSDGGGWLPIYGSSYSSGTKTTTKSSESSRSRILGLSGGHCRHFTLTEIKLATEDFSESRILGVGGFGKVYKGFIDASGRAVAIKRANPMSQQGVHEFQNEIELLSKLRHLHLVSLIGASEEKDEMILVYDYMSNGTLREHLYETKNPALSWLQRLNICIGAARGIHYLHTGAKYTIIHRDVKSTNILLDDKWVAKVSDFGLSKTGQALKDQTHVSTIVKGSFGYLDPEYFRRQCLTDKSDVYSFGVVLFEVLCGRPALNPSLPKEQMSLADWATLNYKRGTLEDIVDPNVKEDINFECFKNFVDVAVRCLSDQGIDRPSMGTVLWNLEYCHQLQDNPNGPKVVAEQRANDEYAKFTTLVSIEEEKIDICEEESDDQSTKAVASQIVDPQVR